MDGTTPGWKYFFDNSDPINCEVTGVSLHSSATNGCGSSDVGPNVLVGESPMYQITVKQDDPLGYSYNSCLRCKVGEPSTLGTETFFEWNGWKIEQQMDCSAHVGMGSMVKDWSNLSYNASLGEVTE